MSTSLSTRLYIRALERAAFLPCKPASNPDTLAVAAAAEVSDSKLPSAGATPVVGHFPVDGACRCGKDKKRSHCVCNSCWFSAPPEIRHELRFGDVRARRAALRVLLEAASGRKALRAIQSEASSLKSQVSDGAHGVTRPTFAKLGLRYER